MCFLLKENAISFLLSPPSTSALFHATAIEQQRKLHGHITRLCLALLIFFLSLACYLSGTGAGARSAVSSGLIHSEGDWQRNASSVKWKNTRVADRKKPVGGEASKPCVHKKKLGLSHRVWKAKLPGSVRNLRSLE